MHGFYRTEPYHSGTAKKVPFAEQFGSPKVCEKVDAKESESVSIASKIKLKTN
jgi:hypothetical protein